MKQPALAFLMFLVFAGNFGAALGAEPSLHQVYQTVETGHLKQAEGMLDEVLRNHPNSAKAHFVEAELLAKEGRLDMARAELGTAQRLALGLPFAKPGALEAMIQRISNPASVPPIIAPPTAVTPTQDFPWGLLLLGLGVITAVVIFIRSQNRPRVLSAVGSGYGAGGNNNGPSFGSGSPQPVTAGGPGSMGPSSSGMASGILGGLATGAAVGAGIVAGEALMHRLFGGNSNLGGAIPRLEPTIDSALSDANDDMGGNDFGIADGGSWDDGAVGGGDDWN